MCAEEITIITKSSEASPLTDGKINNPEAEMIITHSFIIIIVVNDKCGMD